MKIPKLGRRWQAGGALVAVLALSVIGVAPRYTVARDRVVTSEEAAAVQGDARTVAGKTPAGGSASRRTGAGAAANAGLECKAGRNGGATDVGVTGTSIKLAATVVKSGIGSSFLGQVPIALEAVKDKVNRRGGICGRLLELEMVDDSWKREDGLRNIRRFIGQGVFALAVSPSSEGLDAAIRGGHISRAGIPVVGADGMLISQYKEPWVWPVAPSTVSTMHVIAQDAKARGAKSFGLVWDRSYRFGAEGADAFRSALKRLYPGKSVLRADVGVVAGQPGYKEEVDRFNRGCGTRDEPTCDFVAMLLEPGTALQWVKDEGAFGKIGTGGPQPLFVDSFARACGAPCNGMWVWSGYNPPISPFDSKPVVARYVADLRAQSATVDVSNPFVQGGYLGMSVLVEALERVGPNLTRARLRAELDAMRYPSGLTEALQWRPGNHFANASLHAFSVVVNAGSFSGWRYQRTGWVRDRWVGQS